MAFLGAPCPCVCHRDVYHHAWLFRWWLSLVLPCPYACHRDVCHHAWLFRWWLSFGASFALMLVIVMFVTMLGCAVVGFLWRSFALVFVIVMFVTMCCGGFGGCRVSMN